MNLHAKLALLPSSYYISAAALCEILDLECPPIFADKEMGVNVAGIKRIMNMAKGMEVEVRIREDIPTVIPTMKLKKGWFALKADREKHLQEQRDLWIGEHGEIFRMIDIRGEDFECSLSVKAFSGNGVPTKVSER
jgi:hypothetical protein